MKRMAAMLLALVLACTLSGCKDQGEKYCDAVRSDQARLGDMINSSRIDSLLRGLPLLRELSAQAPDDLTDEWQALVNAVAGLGDALKTAGLGAGEFQGGRLPDSVQGQQRRDVVAAADTLASADVLSAAKGIEDQAQDVCQVAIGT